MTTAIYYLYVKTHNKTGLKYLGYTKRKDPHGYKGSGIYWSRHINKHGYDVTTEIIKECSSISEVKQWGEHYSRLWNVMQSEEWANLKQESADGGWEHINNKPKYERINLLAFVAKVKTGELTFGGRTSSTWLKGDPRAARASAKGNIKQREMRMNGETGNWKSKKGIQTKSTLGHHWYRNIITGEKSLFINREIPDGWVLSSEYHDLRKNKNSPAYGKKWYNDGTNNYRLKPEDGRISELGLKLGRLNVTFKKS